MALLKVENKKYQTEKDLRNLLFYCQNHCISVIMNKLYPFGMECIYYQFLYLQSRRIKPLSTKALHYVLSFDTMGYESGLGKSQITSIMSMLCGCALKEYQSILFLHMDEISHYHVHIVINPVNPANLNVCRIGFCQFKYVVADVLAFYKVALQSVTYRDYKGDVRLGNETGCMLYQDLFKQRYNLPDRSFE